MRLCTSTLLSWIVAIAFGSAAAAPPQPSPAGSAAGKTPAGAPTTPDKVDVQPLAKDDQIEERLARILKATHWFYDTTVAVDEGVVFLDGRTANKEQKDWAGRLASKTEDVVAVVNRITVDRTPALDLAPAVAQFEEISAGVVRFLPLAALAAIALLLTSFAASLSMRIGRRMVGRRLRNALLADVAARAIAVPVVFCGIYVALQISGLTRVALTVASAAGLAGLIFGVAFQGILENFLASILISFEHPFEIGDLVKVEDKTGFVQRVTTRGTVLMGDDGTYIQVPNSTMYKSTIHNFTANPKMRKDFLVGVSQTAPIELAQQTATAVLRDHPAILADPEPMVLVDDFAADKVNLRVYFWVDATRFSDLKVRSAAIRLVTDALQKAKILPTPAERPSRTDEKGNASSVPAACNRQVGTAAEGDLRNDAEDLHAQAREAPLPSQGENLLATNGLSRK